MVVINQASEIADTQNNENVFQFIVCEDCGFTHCQSGNWVAIRKFSDIYFIIPAFEWIDEEEVSLKEEYFPPYYLKEKGAIWMATEKFDEFKSHVPSFDKIAHFRELSLNEAIWFYKWDTPHEMFGRLSKPKPLKRHHILSTNVGDIDEMVDSVEKRIKEVEESGHFNIQPLTKNDTTVSFYLNDKKSTVWSALVIHNENIELLLGGQFVLKPE